MKNQKSTIKLLNKNKEIKEVKIIENKIKQKLIFDLTEEFRQ